MKVAVKVLLLCLSASSCLGVRYTCPPRENIVPCTCEEEVVTSDLSIYCASPGTSLSELKRAMRGLTDLRNLNIQLDGLNLGRLPSNFFDGVHIKQLEFVHCELDSLNDTRGRALEGLEDTLQELVIVSSFNEYNIPVRLFLGHLLRLTELDISHNAINYLSNDWFIGGPMTLTHLTISNNGIRRLGEKAFANLVNLKQLSLDGNQFGPIRRSMLPTYPDRLQVLELDNNGLTSIPDDLFRGMNALREVSLRANNIKTLDQTTWSQVWPQIRTLRLEGNPLDCDSRMDWLFRIGKSKFIFGKCQTPRNRAGKDLKDLIKDQNPW